jgi:hypothetical protein
MDANEIELEHVDPPSGLLVRRHERALHESDNATAIGDPDKCPAHEFCPKLIHGPSPCCKLPDAAVPAELIAGALAIDELNWPESQSGDFPIELTHS